MHETITLEKEKGTHRISFLHEDGRPTTQHAMFNIVSNHDSLKKGPYHIECYLEDDKKGHRIYCVMPRDVIIKSFNKMADDAEKYSK